MQSPMGSGTELASPLSEAVGGRQEGPPAIQASHFYSALPYVSPSYVQFIVTNYGPPARPLSEQVAGDTRGHEVIRPVVQAVPIEMVRNDGASTSATLDPLQVTTAPVAGLRPCPDLLHQDQTMFLDVAIARSERVVGSIEVAVSGHVSSITAEGDEVNTPNWLWVLVAILVILAILWLIGIRVNVG
jgi:hypothetical protein